MAEVKEYISNITIPDGTTKYVKDSELTETVNNLSTKVATNETNISNVKTKADTTESNLNDELLNRMNEDKALHKRIDETNSNLETTNTQVKTNQENILTNTNQIATNTTAISEIRDMIYPVGSIYMNINNVNPSALFGGTWEQIKDKFILSSGDTYASGSTGGSATHTHKYGLTFESYYEATIIEGNTTTSLHNYTDDTNHNYSLFPQKYNQNITDLGG